MRLARRLLGVVAGMRSPLPDDTVATALTLASLAGHGPSLVLPAPTRVLVLAPHPDDETIGAGGTIHRLAASGARVEVVLITDGEATIGARRPAAVIGDRRRIEARMACHALGAAEPTALALPDGRVGDELDALITQLAHLLHRHRPQLVLTPWALEAHADHRATTAALAAALADHVAGAGTDIPPPTVWGYEVHTPILRPTHIIDITRSLHAKRTALAAHHTAGVAFDLATTLGLARWRSLATRAGGGAAEAVHATSITDLGALVDAGARLWSTDQASPSG